MSLSKIVRAHKANLVVTPVHEAWLASHSNVELGPDTIDFIVAELAKKQRDRTKSWSGSSQGYCLRRQVLAYLGLPKKEPSTDLAAIFIHGTWTHLKWQAMGMEAGWLWKAEVPCRIEGLNARGTADGLLAADIGWELKSINRNGYRFVSDSGPSANHLRQVHFYMLATGIKVWSLIYEEKDTQQWREFMVDYQDQYAVAVVEELAALNKHRESHTLPEMLPECKAKTGAYRTCPYAPVCSAASWPKE